VYAYDLCKSSISFETIYEWLDFLQSIPFPDEISSPLSTGSSGNGSGPISPSVNIRSGPVTSGSASPVPNGGSPVGGFASPLQSPLPHDLHSHLYSPPPHLRHLAHSHPLSNHPHHYQHQQHFDSFGNPIPLALPQIPPTPSPASIFGVFGPRLREDVFQFLVVSLPEQLSSGERGTTSRALVDVYSRLPFEYFKAAVESPNLQIGVLSI
jgi:hypothetical protein